MPIKRTKCVELEYSFVCRRNKMKPWTSILSSVLFAIWKKIKKKRSIDWFVWTSMVFLSLHSYDWTFLSMTSDTVWFSVKSLLNEHCSLFIFFLLYVFSKKENLFWRNKKETFNHLTISMDLTWTNTFFL